MFFYDVPIFPGIGRARALRQIVKAADPDGI